MEYSHFWQANGRLSIQEISSLLENPNVHTRFHESSTVPTLSQLNPARNFSLYKK
jgi:hypothetical protein